jgi:broad specificity phosphatase PhoE
MNLRFVDVFDRVSSFLESLHRMFAKKPEENYILVTHGVAIRILLMRYFKYTIADYEEIENFHNGEFVVLERKTGEIGFQIAKVVHACVGTIRRKEDGDVETDIVDGHVHVQEQLSLRRNVHRNNGCRKSSLNMSYDNSAFEYLT